MKKFCFTVDDNIRFLKESCERGYGSIFHHPYAALLRRLHERFDLKIQLNLFYRMEGFDLSMMTDRYANEWESCSDWLKLSFHSDLENVRPYLNSDYSEVYGHCKAVQDEILRFASLKSLGETTTVHYCQTTEAGVKALKDNGVKGLLGLFGTDDRPGTSYSLDTETAKAIRNGATVSRDGISFAALDMVINNFKIEDILPALTVLLQRNELHVMIHEQYFYPDYKAYQPDFEEKLILVFDTLRKNGYESRFFDEMI